MKPIFDIATSLQSFGAIGSFVLLVIKATMILLVARLLIAAVPKASAAARHIALTAAICSVLVLPLVAFFVPTWSVAVLPNPAAEAEKSRAIGVTGDEEDAPTALEAAVTVARATGIVAQERITAMSQLLDTVKNSWQGLLLLAVGLVSAFFLLRMVIGVVGVGMVARRSSRVADDEALRELDAACDHLQLDREILLLRSSEISVPVVWGVKQPVLLLPAASSSWPAERLRVVLLHELAHVKRWDGVTLLATRAAVAVFWFHPMIWALERIARSECERACDDLVLATGAKPSDYAEHLLSIARALPHTDPFRSVTLAMSRRSQLEGRLLSILQPRARRGALSMRTMSAFLAMALMVIVPLASVKLVAAPQEAKPGNEAPRDREGIVEIGPAVAAKVMGPPEMLLAGIERFKKKREAAPVDGSEWYGHAYDLYRADKYAEAIEAFKQSIAHNHRVAASKYNIACSYALVEDEANAVMWLQAAIEAGWDDFEHIAEDTDFDPIRSGAKFQQVAKSLGSSTSRKFDRRVEDTLDEFDILRAESSRDGGEWFASGMALLRLRKLDESIEAFENAVRLDSKTSTSLYNIACAYSLKGDSQSALNYLQRAVEHGFDDAEKMQNDPDLRIARTHGRFEQLVTLADDLRLHSGWQGQKWSWIFGGQEEEAWREKVPHFVEMTRKHPQIGRTWFNLGYAQLQSGANAASAQSFQKAVQIGYRPGASTYNAACAYARAGNNTAAFDALEKAYAMGFKLHDYMDDDDDLDSLHDDPRWAPLYDRVETEHHDRKDKR